MDKPVNNPVKSLVCTMNVKLRYTNSVVQSVSLLELHLHIA